jgi:hypothetical protein
LELLIQILDKRESRESLGKLAIRVRLGQGQQALKVHWVKLEIQELLERLGQLALKVLLAGTLALRALKALKVTLGILVLRE